MKNPRFTFFYVMSVAVMAQVITDAHGQDRSIDKAIANHRKGTLTVKAKAGDKVLVEQVSHEFWFGCAISNGFVDGSMSADDVRQYEEKFLQHFNSAVTENAVKWGNMERERGQVDYSVVDGILKWTEKHHIPLRAHNLFWGVNKFVQPWVKQLNDEELQSTLQARAEDITRRYKGRFVEYDLNNEMIHGNYYEDRLGHDITKRMAAWAHQGDPDARLFLNDYDILTGERLDEYMEHIRTLLKQGVPIAGIGVQGHLHAETFDRNELKRALDSLSVFNLPIRITEFNMPGQRSKFYQDATTPITDQEEELKARELVDYYRICFAHPAVTGILMWGFWEGANWIKVSSLYKRDWTPTPAAKAYQDLVYKQWWTSHAATAGKDGTVSVPAFFGRYRVTANGVTKEITLAKETGSATVSFVQ